MAKARKSLFGSNISKEQANKEAKAVERKVLGDTKPREEKSAPPKPQNQKTPAAKPPVAKKLAARTPKSASSKPQTRKATATTPPSAATKAAPKKKGKITRRKFLYVDETHHRAAKLKAIQLGLNMSEYIERLIAKDNK